MDIYHTIIKPIVTEKTSHQSRSNERRGGAYAFQVHVKANKTEIRQAIEQIYGVKVASVRTSMRPGKRRRFRMRIGQTPATKRAVVVLDPDSHIDLF